MLSTIALVAFAPTLTGFTSSFFFTVAEQAPSNAVKVNAIPIPDMIFICSSLFTGTFSTIRPRDVTAVDSAAVNSRTTEADHGPVEALRSQLRLRYLRPGVGISIRPGTAPRE